MCNCFCQKPPLPKKAGKMLSNSGHPQPAHSTVRAAAIQQEEGARAFSLLPQKQNIKTHSQQCNQIRQKCCPVVVGYLCSRFFFEKQKKTQLRMHCPPFFCHPLQLTSASLDDMLQNCNNDLSARQRFYSVSQTQRDLKNSRGYVELKKYTHEIEWALK